MDERIRVGLFLPNLEIGGAENLVLNLLSELLKLNGVFFHLILLGSGGKLADKARGMTANANFRFHELGLPLEYGFHPARQLDRYLDEHGIQLVHSHLYICDKVCFFLKLFNYRVKIISTKHSTETLGLKSRVMNFFSQFMFSKLVFISRNQRDYYRSHSLIFTKWIMIRNGIPLPKRGKRKADANAVPKLVCVGSLKPEKGPDILAKAVNLLGKEGLRFRCDFFGDGPLRPQLEQTVDKRLDVHFNSARPGLSEELGEFDLVIIPSRREGCPLVLMESFAAQVPLIVSDYPTLLELTGAAGERATLFHSEDAEDLAEKIRGFFLNPVSYLEKVEPAFDYALNNSIGKTAESYLRLYANAVRSENAEPELELNHAN